MHFLEYVASSLKVSKVDVPLYHGSDTLDACTSCLNHCLVECSCGCKVSASNTCIDDDCIRVIVCKACVAEHLELVSCFLEFFAVSKQRQNIMVAVSALFSRISKLSGTIANAPRVVTNRPFCRDVKPMQLVPWHS